MIERLRRRDLSVNGAKLGTLLDDWKSPEEGGGGLEVSE
ncbi:unnamed protein product [Brassica rapa subsp. trilocularis]